MTQTMRTIRQQMSIPSPKTRRIEETCEQCGSTIHGRAVRLETNGDHVTLCTGCAKEKS